MRVRNARRTPLDLLATQCPHRAASVQRSPGRVDHSAQEVLTDGRIDHPVGAAHEAACVDALVTVEQHDADIVDIEIEDLAESAVVNSTSSSYPTPGSPLMRPTPSVRRWTSPRSLLSSAYPNALRPSHL